METGIHELTAAYALDALDPEERREYESHLARLRGVPGGARVARERHRGARGGGLRACAASRAPRPHPLGRPRRAADGRPVRAAQQACAPGRGCGRRGGGGRGARDRALGEPASRRPRRGTKRARAAAPGRCGPRRPERPNGRALERPGSSRRRRGRPGRARARATWVLHLPERRTRCGSSRARTPSPPACSRARTTPTSSPSTATVGEGDVVAVTVENEGGAETPTLPLVVASEPV